LAGVIDARMLPDPRGFIQGGTAYFADHFGLVVAAVTAEAVLAHSAAYLLHKYVARRAGGETIRPVCAWSQVFKVDLRGQPTVVHVRDRKSTRLNSSH